MSLGPRQAGAVVKMLDEGYPIPFIARYRKEPTGSADESTLKALRSRLRSMKELDSYKAATISELKDMGVDNTTLFDAIEAAEDIPEVSDLRLHHLTSTDNPFATEAIAIIDRQPSDISLPQLLDKLVPFIESTEQIYPELPAFELPDTEGLSESQTVALRYLMAAMAQEIGTSPKARRLVRQRFNRQSYLSCQPVDENLLGSIEYAPYEQLFGRNEILRTCPPQRMLLMGRGYSDNCVRISLTINGNDNEATSDLKGRLSRMFIRQSLSPELLKVVSGSVELAYDWLLAPAISIELIENAYRKAQEAMIDMMGDSLRTRLMAPPYSQPKRIMGVFPESSDLVNVVCLQPGEPFTDATVISVASLRPISDSFGSSEYLGFLIQRNLVEAIAIAEMPGTKGFETLLRGLELSHPVGIHYINARSCELVAEASIAADPNLQSSPDAVFEKAVAAGRILIDPMVQFVKVRPERLVDPMLHPEQVDQKALSDKLFEIESACAAAVGPDPNYASVQLLRLIPGLGQKLAENIVSYRVQNGPFKSRNELLNVSRMGAKAFTLSAGFLRIANSENPLDATFIHPDRYEDMEKIAADMGVSVDRLIHSSQLQNALSITLQTYANRHLNAGTLKFILESLKLGHNDPRAAAVPTMNPHVGGPAGDSPNRMIRSGQSAQGATATQASIDPEFIATLHIGQIIDGRVSHIAPYGAFVNIGHNTSGLLHVSQMSEDFVNSPEDVIQPGQNIRVKILDIDPRLLRIALTLKGVEQPV